MDGKALRRGCRPRNCLGAPAERRLRDAALFVIVGNAAMAPSRDDFGRTSSNINIIAVHLPHVNLIYLTFS
jgi:hypothetical protein